MSLPARYARQITTTEKMIVATGMPRAAAAALARACRLWSSAAARWAGGPFVSCPGVATAIAVLRGSGAPVGSSAAGARGDGQYMRAIGPLGRHIGLRRHFLRPLVRYTRRS